MKYIYEYIIVLLILLAWIPIMMIRLIWHLQYYSFKAYIKEFKLLNEKIQQEEVVDSKKKSKWQDRMGEMQELQRSAKKNRK